MQTITVPYVLDQLTHSTVWVGVGAFATFFPATVVGPLAGALADRHDRRTILLISQVILMTSALTLWGIWVAGVATPPMIVAVVVVGAIGAGITIAAWQAFVPQLVPPEAMVSVVRLNAMQFTGARAFGPALAGLVLAEFGPGTAFLANAASFLLVIGALLLIVARPSRPTLHPAACSPSSETRCATSASARCSSSPCSVRCSRHCSACP